MLGDTAEGRKKLGACLGEGELARFAEKLAQAVVGFQADVVGGGLKASAHKPVHEQQQAPLGLLELLGELLAGRARTEP